jgi:hypothetical protein
MPEAGTRNECPRMLRKIYSGLMLDLNSLDLEEIGNALAEQTDYEHRWLISPQTGEIVFWTADTGIDGQTPVDVDELDLVCIDPLPSWVWYQDMADFAEAITDEPPGAGWHGASRAKAHSAGSRTSSTTSIRTSCQRGTHSATSAPSAGPSSGWPTIHSSTMTPPAVSWPTTQIPICPDSSARYKEAR